jgi:hypothetical protein
MKNKTKVPKKLPIPKEVSLPDPPLKADELIDLLKRSSDETAQTVMDAIFEMTMVLLFLQKVMDQDDDIGDLTLRVRGETTNYCNADNAIAFILKPFIERLYEARILTDEGSLKVHAAVRRYREAHPKRASA